MRSLATVILLSLLVPATSADAADADPYSGPSVRIETTEGVVTVQLAASRAPKTVANFLDLVRAGFYEGTVFHRVDRNYVIQGGGFTADLKLKEGDKKIENESRNGLSNLRGTIAMARTRDPHSANSQFYFNLSDNENLDADDYRWGYTVFGRVIEGLDVLDAINDFPTGPAGQFSRDVPLLPIIIKKATVLKDEAPSQ